MHVIVGSLPRMETSGTIWNNHVETIGELPIRIASLCTQCKLWMIRVWILEVLIGMAGRGRLIWISVL